VRERREDLVLAAREARLLEKLKDKHDDRCREELRCAENVAIDEIAARYTGGR
jgi:flagellar biosynthesis chaperone FliJ